MAFFKKISTIPAIIFLSILAISCCLIFTLNFDDANPQISLSDKWDNPITRSNTSPSKLEETLLNSKEDELILFNSSNGLPIPRKEEPPPRLSENSPIVNVKSADDNQIKQMQQTTTTTKGPHRQYIDMDAYKNYNRTSNPIKRIPTSWTELEEQQFCHLNKVKSSENDPTKDAPQVSFLKYIYDIQFGQDCNAPTTKFVIYPIQHEKEQGLGASLLGNLKRFFIVSMMQKRVFLLTGQYDWTKDHEYCDGYDAMECYFLPISNCNAKDVLSRANISDNMDYYEGTAPEHCEFGNNNKDGNLEQCQARIIYAKYKTHRYVMNNGDIKKWTMDRFGLGMMAYEAMICQFFMRPRIEIRKIIYDKISKSIRKSLDDIDIKPETIRTKKVLSYPIRASDKCRPEDVLGVTGKHYTHKSEAACFTPEEHVRVMNAINYFMGYQQWTVILTSEDETFLDMVVKSMYDESVSNVTNWRYIRNTEDFSVGEGTTTYKGTLRHFHDQHLRNGTGTSLETDHIVSALSSLIFQVHLEPEYIVIGDSSTWLKLMWKWLYFMNCNIKPEMHRNDKDDMTQCIELRTPGYLHYYGNFPYKFVKFPQDMWRMMQAEQLVPDKFEDKFGINITQYGWDKWCGAGFDGWSKY